VHVVTLMVLVPSSLLLLLLLHPATLLSKLGHPQQPPTSPSSPLFDVVWNSDLSLHCQALNATLRLEENGIRTNTNQAWFGRTIATLYGAGGAMPSADGPNGSLVNGGIPQLANRSLIEQQTQILLEAAVPADFDGLGVFDIEYPQLYPLWQYDFGPGDQLVRRLATNYSAARSGLNGSALVNRTVADFNSGMQALWQLQLRTAKRLYPHATFGYYRMPHCWFSEAQPTAPCNGQMSDGDALAWLWATETGLFPGVYFASGATNRSNRDAIDRLISTVRESIRVAQGHGGGRPKVMPFVSYAYRGGPSDHHQLPDEMMWAMVSAPASLGADGVVIWGGSGDALTVDCKNLSAAFDRLQPRLKALRAELTECASVNCTGHGRCARWYSPMRCVCNAGWTGPACATPR
jgi:hypothetical protein